MLNESLYIIATADCTSSVGSRGVIRASERNPPSKPTGRWCRREYKRGGWQYQHRVTDRVIRTDATKSPPPPPHAHVLRKCLLRGVLSFCATRADGRRGAGAPGVGRGHVQSGRAPVGHSAEDAPGHCPPATGTTRRKCWPWRACSSGGT